MSIATDVDGSLTPSEAIALQKELAGKVIQNDALPTDIRRVAGVDVGFEQQGQITRAAVAVLDFSSMQLVDYSIARIPTVMPYIPGLLSFRECPAILKALDQLRQSPDLLLCDGQGIAHPRRFGVACHLGVLTGLPAIGVAKSWLCGSHGELAEARGSQADLVDKGEVIGRLLRSRDSVRPLYVSIGHRVSLTTAIDYVQSCLSRYRLPEPVRWADALASRRGNALEKASQLLPQ
ncbi:deoxyribonuclease V [Endozoicomonas sp. OPT23]|uniref:deoxyribonuclease V n=1 Tax=Endozoicomonas sp. OPT23 TaxID=2072845 RepID=UPI00129C09E9|nr:deoxyribonuclease V [Endozoicomonas sp. OPT23]MRI32047.1 deoxyribonuclease V [Endozoicomonas sp. OPT23]